MCSSPTSPRPSTPVLETFLPPKTIILGLWPLARDEHINYYLEGYQALYPSARVILLRYSKSADQLAVALDSLTLDDEKLSFDSSPTVLLHLFGNAGAAQICHLLRAFKIQTGQALGVKATIMDTVPTVLFPSFDTSTRTPRKLLELIYLAIVVVMIRFWSVLAFWNSETASDKLRHDLNSADLLPANVAKCYVWPDRDVMSTWSLSKGDDDECEQHDYAVRRNFVDCRGRWTGDQERYWMGIEDAWECR